MKIIKQQQPFLYLDLENFFTLEQNNEIYTICINALDVEKYNSRELFLLDNEYDTAVGMLGLDISEEITNTIENNLKTISDSLDIQGVWQYCMNVSNPDGYLGPHNDDYNVNKLSNPGAGVIKVLIYIGKEGIDYSNYGTKLYDKKLNFIKEVPYVSGNGFAFTPNKDSYHGTDFKGKLNNYRFILGAELTYA